MNICRDLVTITAAWPLTTAQAIFHFLQKSIYISSLQYNNPEKRCLKMPSNIGIGTARGLAEVHSLVVQGKILSRDILELISKPQLIDEVDVINGYPENKGFGWQYYKNKLVRN